MSKSDDLHHYRDKKKAKTRESIIRAVFYKIGQLNQHRNTGNVIYYRTGQLKPTQEYGQCDDRIGQSTNIGIIRAM